MAANPLAMNDTSRQSDLLLWVAGGVVATVGVAWLLISQPWSAGPERTAATAPRAAAGTSDGNLLAMAAPAASAERPPAQMLNDPLKMARLAFDAGMLVEPQEYSAWTLYANVLEAEPASMEAREGLTKIAEELLRRGETALEQGRFDDVRDTVARILSVLPAHEGATALAARVSPQAGIAAAVVPAVFEVQIPQEQPLPTLVAPTPAAAVQVRRAPPAVDPVAQAHEAFTEALAASRLLTPTEQSAKHFVAVLTTAAPEHELTLDARERLSGELLSRAAKSLETLDTDAATTWIDEAQLIGVDNVGVNAVRSALTTQLIILESAKLLPASSLKVTNYVPPKYPERALDRGIEGWVDLQFTVAIDGTTHDINVTDASHQAYFRNEALAAVTQWRFEPRVFMSRTIEQRAYTQIRFVQ